ncbi:DUF2141 domain-containing protein [Citromicrobium bathyomarinum]|jgi:uncharacterized protein (DUF2141 family)|uniref:DUF2141 domain-containing protein n=1 Tax=Sphingomonadales TaxID=204457 RepID=UPI000C603E76|nr:hypothetical protein [Citromicrobium sp.]|tara:strand:- start:65 stop:532 length:468 start_codon:yes stop_codon:yes gene_type:complete
MQNRPGTIAKLPALALGGAALLTLGNSAKVPQDVVVTVVDVRSADGSVLACLTPSEGAFPDCGEDERAQRRMVRANARVTIVFNDVPPGEYAISLLHDENGNGKADTVLFLPKEGFGFSRDAKARFGPPKFSAAAFTVDSDAPVYQKIRMRYMSR